MKPANTLTKYNYPKHMVLVSCYTIYAKIYYRSLVLSPIYHSEVYFTILKCSVGPQPLPRLAILN